MEAAFLTDHIDHKFHEFIDSWPGETLKDLFKYFVNYRVRLDQEHKRKNERPYWIDLPFLLLKSLTKNRRIKESDKKLLKDIAWAQYSVFLAIRLHDDLYDAQTGTKSVIYAGDKLLMESGELLSKHFTRTSPFWKNYYTLINTSINAIIQVDYIQSSKNSDYKKLLRCYADVCAIFKIGSLAVCSLCNKMHLYKKISSLIDCLSIAGQMSDDLNDIAEDSARGRYNSAYLYLLKRQGISKSKTAANRINRKTEIESRLDYINEIKKQIEDAEKIIRSLNFSGLMKILEGWNRYFEQYADLKNRIELLKAADSIKLVS